MGDSEKHQTIFFQDWSSRKPDIEQIEQVKKIQIVFQEDKICWEMKSMNTE